MTCEEESVKTLDCAITTFMSSRIGVVSPKTLRINEQYLGSLAEYFGAERAVETVTLADLRCWRASLFAREVKYVSESTWRPTEKGKLSVHTIHGMVRMCRQFFKWLVTEGLLETDPARRLELPALPKGPPKSISDADVAKMLDAVSESPRDLALLWFLRDTGCRLGGVATARLRDLDLDRGTVIVWEKGRGGQRVARAVFLKETALAALRTWLAERPGSIGLDGKETTDAIFVNSRFPHAALTEGAIYRLVKRIAEKAGVLHHANPHAFRHGLARRMLQNGAPLGAVSEVLGHSDIKVTHEFYGVYVSQELKDAHTRWA